MLGAATVETEAPHDPTLLLEHHAAHWAHIGARVRQPSQSMDAVRWELAEESYEDIALYRCVRCRETQQERRWACAVW